MRFSIRPAVHFMATVALAAFGFAPCPARAQAPDKPQNPLEIKAPGKGEEKAYKAFQTLPVHAGI
jgi:hypothetical protein